MENAKKLSQIAQDQPESALERAVFWTEYIIRHKGAKHLRPPGQHLNWIQLHSLDVVAFLLSFIIVPSLIAIFILKKMCSSVSKYSGTKEKVN
jgi:glucuronosyltransferase